VADPKLCLASDFNDGNHLSNGLCYEACHAIASIGNSSIISPVGVGHGEIWKAANKVYKRVTGLPHIATERVDLREQFDCFLYICMNPENLVALNAIRGWQENAARSAVFLFETWSAMAHKNRHFLRLLDDFDHVFLFNADSVPTIQTYTSTPCSFLPAASDCLKATPYPRAEPRTIDIFGMGRTWTPVHEQLIEMTRTGDLFYLWDHTPGDVTHGYDIARLRTHNLIRRSRFFTSFNFAQGDKLPFSAGEDAIAARMFEAAGGGAVQIGTAPRVPEFHQLFDWPDALIEIPQDPLDLRAFYQELQSDPRRIHHASVRAASNALRRHDWIYRLEVILQTLGLPEPSGVAKRKGRLATLAALAEGDLA
jgi:hypothetical protein